MINISINELLVWVRTVYLEMRAKSILIRKFIRTMGIIEKILIVVVFYILSLLFIRIILGSNPGFDALNYHLPMVALMVQETGFISPIGFYSPIISYPNFVEIWFHWIYIFFGNDQWVDAAQFPFLVLMINLIYAIGRRMSFRPFSALMGALCFMAIPVVVEQSVTNYIDLAVSFFILWVVYLLIWLHQVDTKQMKLPVFLFALSCGLLLGSKYSAIKYLLVIFPVFFMILINKKKYFFYAFKIFFLVGLIASLLGLSVYVKNWLLLGNPFYPFELNFSFLDFPGPRTLDSLYGVKQTANMTNLEAIFKSWISIKSFTYSEVFGGFGPVLWMMISCFFASFIVLIRQKNFLVLSFYLMLVVLFGITQLNFRARFVLFFLAIGCVSIQHLIHTYFSKNWIFQFRELFSSAISEGRDCEGGDLFRKKIPVFTTAGIVPLCFLVFMLHFHWMLYHSFKNFKREDLTCYADSCCDQKQSDRSLYSLARNLSTAEKDIYLLASEDFFPLTYCLWKPGIVNKVLPVSEANVNFLLDDLEQGLLLVDKKIIKRPLSVHTHAFHQKIQLVYEDENYSLFDIENN